MGGSIRPGTSLLWGGDPSPTPPLLTTSGQMLGGSHVLPLLTTLQAAAGLLGLWGGDVGRRWPQGKHHPHPASPTPLPPQWPQDHGDGGFQNTGTAEGCRGDREERWKGGGGAPGLVHQGVMVKLGLAARGAHLLPM